MSHNICITATKGEIEVEFPVYQTPTSITRSILQQGKKEAINAYVSYVLDFNNDVNHVEELGAWLRAREAAKCKIKVFSN